MAFSRQANSSSSKIRAGFFAPPPEPSYVDPPTADFSTHEDFEFFRSGNTAYRLSVLTINQIAYVGISHWWFNKAAAQWYPSKKQLFIPKCAWYPLLDNAERATAALNELPDDPTSQEGKTEIILLLIGKDFFSSISEVI